jgi:hypothetical protein
MVGRELLQYSIMNPSNVLRAVFLGCFVLFDAPAFAFVLPSASRGRTRTAHDVKTNADDQRQQQDCSTPSPSRRGLLVGTAVALMTVAVAPQTSWGVGTRYMMDEETGEYVQVEDADWQTEWKGRLDKASTMTKDEIFQAARGAGNTDLKTGPESDSSKKRRAMSACRDPNVRAKTGLASEKECTARVFGGDVDFLLEAL